MPVRTAPGRVLRDECGEPAVHAARHHRFHLPADACPDHHDPYAGSYPGADLTWRADRIREWDLAGNDVFVYFNNDASAVRNARILRALLVSGEVSHPATSAVNSSWRSGASVRDRDARSRGD
jgi:uncharacterized protein YecE (DUF72 family)